MSHKLFATPEFIEDVATAALDLELAEPGLGGELYRDVEALQRRIAKNPRLWQIARFNVRRAHLKKFKRHAVHFEIYAGDVYLIGLYHDRQDPESWRHAK